jgi:hypothetical protein
MRGVGQGVPVSPTQTHRRVGTYGNVLRVISLTCLRISEMTGLTVVIIGQADFSARA